jgi:hypothetical protein
MVEETDLDVMSEKKPTKMSDKALYKAFQHAKSHGPVERIDELQLEITKRWEAKIEMYK